MLIELNFHRLDKQLKAGDISKKLREFLSETSFDIPLRIVSATTMSRWAVILIEIPDTVRREDVCLYADAVAGLAVEFFLGDLRYRHYELHGEGSSLIFKDKESVP